jgi:hypothetical protein
VRVLVVVGVLFFAVCVLMKTSPVRTTAFVSVPLGLVVVASVGAIAAQRANGLLHLGATSLLFVSAVLGGYAVQDQATPDTWPPVENWMGAAQYIGATFPTGTTVYVAPDEPPRFLRGYIDDGYPVIGGFDPFDPAAFAAGRLVVVHFATGSEEDFDPGSPFVETDLLQQRGMRPAHVMRILFAPFLVVDRLMCRSPMSRLLSFTTAICPRP